MGVKSNCLDGLAFAAVALVFEHGWFGDVLGAKSENEKLREEIALLRQQLIGTQISGRELEQLKELLGRTAFPPIGELPYFVTRGPYGFFWFLLREEAEARGLADKNVAQQSKAGGWTNWSASSSGSACRSARSARPA